MIEATRLIATSDTHFDSKPRNNYRWDLFPWLKSKCQELEVPVVIISGDIFNETDYHSSYLVNKFVDNVKDLLTVAKYLLMIKGNHDRIDDNEPYLKWINNIPNVRFFIKPELLQIGDTKHLFIPFTKDPKIEWQSIQKEMSEADFIWSHQTYNGAISENGTKLSGLSQSLFDCTKAKVYSGDIHKAGLSDRVEYLGTPYPVRFGDNFLHRVVCLDLETRKPKNLYFKTLDKYTVTINTLDELKKLKLKKGDQLQVKIAVEDIIDWKQNREEIISYCKQEGIELFKTECIKKDSTISLEEQKSKLKNLTTSELFDKFCKRNEVGTETQKYGAQIIDQASKV